MGSILLFLVTLQDIFCKIEQINFKIQFGGIGVHLLHRNY